MTEVSAEVATDAPGKVTVKDVLVDIRIGRVLAMVSHASLAPFPRTLLPHHHLYCRLLLPSRSQKLTHPFTYYT